MQNRRHTKRIDGARRPPRTWPRTSGACTRPLVSKSGEITGVAGDPAAERDSPSGADFTAAAPPRRSPHKSVIVSAALAILLGSVAWWGSGALFADKHSREAAEAWNAVRSCLLGDGGLGGVKPSERMRRIRLGVAHTPLGTQWPGRCAAHAERLDAALSVRELAERLGPLPSAAAIARGSASPTDIDELYAELELADLPLPKQPVLEVPAAPEPADPKWKPVDVAPLGQVIDLGAIDVASDGDDGRMLRLLLPEVDAPLVCRLNDGPRAERWQSAACRAVPMATRPSDRLRLARAEPGAPDLIHAADAGDRTGFYDASTGQRIWRPRYFDAQAMVRVSGQSTIFHADMRDDRAREGVEQFRLVDMQPGKRPKSRSASMPTQARGLLWPELLLHWYTEDRSDALMALPFRDLERKPLRVGELPSGSRYVADCASAGTRAALFVAGVQERRYALLFQRGRDLLPPLDVGVIAGKLSLSCHDGRAILSRVGERIARWTCDPQRCQMDLSQPLPEARVMAAGPIGKRIALAWMAHGEPLRFRVAEPAELSGAKDTLLFDDELHGGLEPIAMRLIGADGLALLLLQDAGNRVYALRVSESDPKPVRVVR